jgi:magnesium transporter
MEGVHTRAWRGSTLVAEGFALEAVSEHLADPGLIVWVDLCAPDKEQLELLADELSLHELAVEDALGEHQRPKVDYYDTHAFLSFHAVDVDDATGTLVSTEVDAFVNDHWLITVRKDARFSIDPVVRRWDRSPHLLEEGVGYLLYGLIDLIVDGYFTTASKFDDYYDVVSEGLFAEKPLSPDQQRQWFAMRRALVRFHRFVVPMREAVSGLMRREHEVVNAALYPYFQDVYDHILRVSETTDALRDLVGTIVETNLTLREYRQNQIMKKVTSWAAIIAVPTLITGFYGMNVPYPGADEHWGWVTAASLTAAISVFLYVLFRRRDWL